MYSLKARTEEGTSTQGRCSVRLALVAERNRTPSSIVG